MARNSSDWQFIGKCAHCNCAIWYDEWEDEWRFKNADPDCKHFHPELREEEEEE